MKKNYKDPAGRPGKLPRLLRVWQRLVLYLATLLLFSVASFAQSGVAPVNPPVGGFKIDGSLKVSSAAGDWVSGTGTGGYIFNADRTRNGALNANLFRDGYNSASDLMFTEGSKFNDDPNTWNWATSSPPDKNDIDNAMYFLTTDPATGDTWIIIGGDRLTTNGTSYIDFEFLQKALTRNTTNNGFTSSGTQGGRTVNDLVISMEYSNGGTAPKATVYRWLPSGPGYSYAEVAAASLTGKVFIATNGTSVEVPFGAFGSTVYAPFAFVEAAINVSALFGSFDNCLGINVKTIFIKTKASDSHTAALKDLVDPIPVSLSFGTAEISYNSPFCKEGKASVSFSPGSVTNGTFSSTPGLVLNSATGEVDLATSTPGTYTITYTFATRGCTRSATTQIIINDKPNVPVLEVAQPTCNTATGNITVTSPVGTGLQYSIDGGTNWQVENVFAGLTAKAYTIWVKNAAGCIVAGNPVTINAQPGTPAAPGFIQNQTACETDVIPTLTAAVTVPDNVRVIWYSEAGDEITDPSLNEVGTVTYYAEAVNEQGCPSKTRTAVTLTINGRPAAPVLAPVHPTCALNTGTIKITSNTENYTFSVNNGAFQPYPVTGFSGLPAGDHTVRAMNSAGCISLDATITLNAQPETPAQPQVTVTQPTCAVATGKIEISSPKADGLLYSINGVDYQPETVFHNLPKGNYTVTAKSAAGCISPGESVVINEQPATPAAPQSGGDLIVCETNSIPVLTAIATAPDNAAVVWYDAPTGGSVVENPTLNQIGTVTYYAASVSTDLCESAERTPVKLTIKEKPAKPVVTNGAFCASASASPVNLMNYIQANGTVLFTDQYGVELATQPTTVSLATANTFTYYVVQQVNGCVSDVASFSITINENPAVPTVEVTQPTCVQTASISVTSPTGAGLLYSLDGVNWQTEKVFSNLVAATYTVKVKNASDCITQGEAITVNPVPAAPDAPVVKVKQATCTDAFATLEITSATTNLLFSLNNGPFESYPANGYSIPAGGSYTLKAKNSAACESELVSGTVAAQPATPAKPDVEVIQPTCAVSTGTITVKLQEGDGILYSKNGMDYQESNVFTDLAPGTYTIILKNAAGCKSESTQVTITSQPATPAVPVAGNNQVACESNTIPKLTATASTPEGINLVWYNAPTGGSVVENPSLNRVGMVTYYAEAQSSSGCISASRAAVTLTINGKPTTPVLVANHPTCETSTGGITINQTAGLEFSIDDKPFGAYPTGGFTELAPGVHTVKARNAADCISDIATITIKEQPATPAKPTITSVDPTCTKAGSITVTAPLGSEYWYSIDGRTWQTGTVFSGLAADAYQVFVKNATNCISEPTIVTINPVPAAPAAPTVQLTEISCNVATAVLTISSDRTGLLFSFNDGEFKAYPPEGYSLAAGSTYKLVAKNAADCESTAITGKVDAQPATPTANAGPAKVITCTSLTVQLEGSSDLENVEFAWVASNGGRIIAGANTATPTVDAAGTYTLTVTNPNGGCEATASVAVSENKTAPVASISGVPELTCSTPKVTLTGSANIQGANFSWSGPEGFATSTASIEVSAAGVYTLTVTNSSNGCTDQEVIEVVNKTDMPVVSAGQAKELSCTVTTAVLSGTVAENDQELFYSWTVSDGGNIVSGANTLTPTVNKAGTYTLVVTNLATGCQVNAVTTVTMNNEVPIASGGPAKVLSCKAGTVQLNGSSNIENAEYAWEASNGGNIVSGGTTASPIVDKAGTYTLTVTHPVSGCTATSVVQVTENKQAPALTLSTPAPITCNNPSVPVSVTTAEGMQISWTGPNGFTSEDSTITATTSGTYEVTVTDPVNGCTAKASVVVPQATTLPDAMAGADKVLTCATQTVVLTGTSSYTGTSVSYNWYDSKGNLVETGLTAIVDEPGMYTFVVKDEETGCASSDVAEVTQDGSMPDVLISTAGLGRITCVETSVKLTGYSETAGVTYSWTGPNNFTANTADIVVTVPGKYELTVTNPENGCSATASYTVTDGVVYAEVNAGPDKVLTCANPTVTLEGFTDNPQIDSWRWEASNGGILPADAHTLTPVISVPGTYTLIVTSKTGCVSSDAVVVTGNTATPMANISMQNPAEITCSRTSVELVGVTNLDGAVISWTGPEGFTSDQATIEVTVPGTYTFIVTNPTTGCTASDSEKVYDGRAYPKISAGPDKVLTCTANTVTLEGSSDDISGIMNYYWTASNGGHIVTGERTMNPVVDAAGTYTLTMRNMIIGCESTDVVEVTLDQTGIAVDISKPQAPHITCNQPVVVLTAVPRIGNELNQTGLTFSWTGPNGFTAALQSIEVTLAGEYTVTVRNPVTGCTGRATTTVEGPFYPLVEAGPAKAITCSSPTATLQGSSANYVEGWHSIMWVASDGGHIVSGANTFTPIVDAAGTYTLTISDSRGGCEAYDEVMVTGNTTAPIANITVQNTPVLTCNNTTAILYGSTALEGALLAWTGPEGFTSNQASIEVSVPGVYTFTVTDPTSGCTAYDTEEVYDGRAYPVISAGPDKVLTCTASTVVLEGSSDDISGIMHYYWTASNGGNIVSGAQTMNPVVNAPGTYTLTMRNMIIGCESTDVVVVTSDSTKPTITATGGTLDCANGTLQLQASSTTEGVTYAWTGPEGFTSDKQNPTVAVPGEYTVTVTHQTSGCSNSTAVIVNPKATTKVPVVTCHDMGFNYGEYTTGLISTINTPEGLVRVTGKKRNADGSFEAANHAALFDTQAPTGDDTDLYTTDWGLALIINQDQTNLPNDNQWGGYLDLDYSAIGPVTMKSLKALDIDGYENMSWVYLYDGEGKELYKVQLKNLGNNSKQTVDLGNTKGVMLMRVAFDGRNESGHLAGSGAIDEIEFCVEELVENPCEEEKAPAKPVVHISAYPVPFGDRTTVEFKLTESESYELNLYDNKGTLVKRLKAGTAKAGELIKVEVDANGLNQGMYIARLMKPSGSQSIKLVVHRK